jgi:hypothetical protein
MQHRLEQLHLHDIAVYEGTNREVAVAQNGHALQYVKEQTDGSERRCITVYERTNRCKLAAAE